MSALDNILLSRIRKGDEEAFAVLFGEYYVPMCRYARLFLKDKESSEDVAMVVFTKIWKNRSQIESVNSMSSYLFRSVRNGCLNQLRKKAELDGVKMDPSMENLLTCEDSSIEVNELNRFIEEAIMALPEKCRDVFVKSRYDRLTNREIAEQMSISVKTVEAQITKALKRIKEHIDSNR